jgi:hypothetical protein
MRNNKKRPTSTPKLTTKKALTFMRTGSRLVQMRGTEFRPAAWYVVPGGLVDTITATAIRVHPAVVAGEDGLFPGHHQTWRMIAFAQ